MSFSDTLHEAADGLANYLSTGFYGDDPSDLKTLVWVMDAVGESLWVYRDEELRAPEMPRSLIREMERYLESVDAFHLRWRGEVPGATPERRVIEVARVE